MGGARFLGYHSLWEEALITIIYSRAKKNAKEAAEEREREEAEGARTSSNAR